jgi:hypothetical protein
MSQIPPTVCDGPEALRVIKPVLRYSEIAEIAERRSLGVGGRHTLRRQPIDFQLQV